MRQGPSPGAAKLEETDAPVLILIIAHIDPAGFFQSAHGSVQRAPGDGLAGVLSVAFCEVSPAVLSCAESFEEEHFCRRRKFHIYTLLHIMQFCNKNQPVSSPACAVDIPRGGFSGAK